LDYKFTVPRRSEDGIPGEEKSFCVPDNLTLPPDLSNANWKVNQFYAKSLHPAETDRAL
jgi:hypothetical protein